MKQVVNPWLKTLQRQSLWKTGFRLLYENAFSWYHSLAWLGWRRCSGNRSSSNSGKIRWLQYLTHLPSAKWPPIKHTKFSNAFSWMKKIEFWLKFHWKWFLSVGSDNWLAPNRRQTIIWANAYPIDWRIYSALAGDELVHHAFRMIYYFIVTDRICAGHVCFMKYHHMPGTRLESPANG